MPICEIHYRGADGMLRDEISELGFQYCLERRSASDKIVRRRVRIPDYDTLGEYLIECIKVLSVDASGIYGELAADLELGVVYNPRLVDGTGRYGAYE